MGFEGSHAKKYGFKGGASQKNMVCKGGSPKKIAFKFSSDNICNDPNLSAS